MNAPARETLPFKAKLILGSFGLLVSLIVVEIAFRILAGSIGGAKWSDRPYAYFMPAGAHSLQDTDRHPKAPGTFRIAVVGDSFTFGPHLQLADTFPKKLEEMLNLNPNARRVEVLNRGLSGASTANETELVQRALKEEPDLLILEITLNDAEPHILSDDERRKLFGAPWLEWKIFSWWRSLGFIAQRFHNSRTVSRYIDYHIKFFKDPQSYGVFSSALDAIATHAREAKVPVVAVVFPLFDFPIDDRYPFRDSHAQVHKALEQAGIKAIDLSSAYRNIPPSRLQVIPGDDNHPNEIAHRIAAERILAALIHENLVPAETAPERVFRQRKDIKAPSVDPARTWPRASRKVLQGGFASGGHDDGDDDPSSN